MSIVFGSALVQVTTSWDNFKSTVLSKSLAVQYHEDGFYTIFSIDGQVAHICYIYKDNVPDSPSFNQTKNDEDKTDFELNFKVVANGVMTSPVPGNQGFRKQVDVFTSTSTGNTASASNLLSKNFAISVSATGPVLSWEVVLEGSLDGTRFTSIMVHTDLTGDGSVIFSGALVTPCLYFRTRCKSIVLGLGTSVTATVVGTN